MRHVFVETNWLVACLAPAHHKTVAALELLERAQGGEVLLHLPAICVAECQRPLREKFQVKREADGVRKFLLWARSSGSIDRSEEETVRRTLGQMEGLVKRDLDRLSSALKDICAQNGVEIFHIEEEMWVRTTQLSYLELKLEPFDQAILGSILVKAEMLRRQGVESFAFCEADSDLQPWNRTGEDKKPLVTLYDEAHIWVYSDFLMQLPAIPDIWPRR